MNPFSSISPAPVNHLLAQEPWARTRLAVHAGKIAVLDAGLVRLSWQVTADGMFANAPADRTPQVVIHVKPADVPLILQNRERAVSYVRIEGDADFANTISQLSQSLKWEAEEDLSRWVGDIAANRIVAGARSVASTARATQQALAENVAEYFLEENPMLMRPEAIADFGREVGKLRDDLERLEKRVRKL